MKWRRIVSILCSLSLVAGMVPSALAADRAATDGDTANGSSLSDHVVKNTVTPSGIVLNLFDYWVTDNRTDADTSTGAEYSDKGINKDHYLKFSTGIGAEGKSINNWTKSSAPFSGIVEKKLVGGYPQVAEGLIYDSSNTTQKQSLAYLFDKSTQDGKETFWNVQGLLQVDSDGYYYYNADNKKCWNGTNHSGYQTANFAEFNKTTNRFALYDSWGVNASGDEADSLQGQFFPFNSATGDTSGKNAVFSGVDSDGKLTHSNIKSHDGAINHYFGMTMTTRFVQRYGGKTTNDTTAKDMTFEFAGDDDVWVFIDGILVCDLGGIHNQATTSINFATGKIMINNDEKTAVTLKEVMSPHYSAEENAKNWTTATDKGGNLLGTFADNTYHTMKLFYLERGGTDSNLAMKFNLAHVPETDGIKVDQYGVALPGVSFALYAATANENGGYDCDLNNPLADGTTDAQGRFVLADGSEATISLNELKQKGIRDLVLRETSTRSGYRPSEDFYLHLEDDKADILLLNDLSHQWRTGSYAQPKESVYVNPNISFCNKDGSKSDQGTDISAPGHGKMFAVIMRRMDNVGVSAPSNSDQWGIVTGSALKGWNVTEPSGGRIENVVAVVTKPENRDNYFVFEPCSNGSYMTELNNCPGDMRNYYFWVEEKTPTDVSALKDVGYAIAYYYTTANSIEDATTENTYWVYSGINANFERQFTATLYIPNVQNYLRVQKTDTEGNPVNGATFSLYKKKDVTVTTDEATGAVSYEIDSNAKVYDTAVTKGEHGGKNWRGIANFPQNSTGLDVGEYYLIETAAPAGYLLNPTPIHVVVDERGVLVDAGTDSDGVSVSVSEGSLVSTMRQFADPDGIDYTLTDVKATQLIGAYNEKTHQVDFTDADDPRAVSHMTVDRKSILENITYSPYDPNTLYDPDDSHTWPGFLKPWTTESGWIWFRMEQEYDGYSMQAAKAQGQVYKENLGKTDITPLFAAMTTVTVRDQPVGSLAISKTVETAAGSTETLPVNQNFTFTVQLKNAKGVTLAANTKFKLVGGSTEGSGATAPEDTTAATDANGTFTVTLKHGQRYTIDDLPVGTKWTVTEEKPAEGTWTTRVNGEANTTASGTIGKASEADEAAFLNIYGTAVITPAVSTPIAVSKRYDTSDSDKDDVKNIQTVFTITAKSPENAPMPEVNREVTITGEGTGKFGAITFNKEGTYTYLVSEKDTNVPGMVYDRTEYEVTFTVAEDKTTGNLKVDQVSYAKAGAETTEQQPAEEVPVEAPAGDPVENPTPENPPENPELKPGQSENPTQNPEQNPAENPAETPAENPDNQPQQDPEPRVDENPMNQLAGESLQADNAPEEESAPLYSKETGFTFVNHYRKPAEVTTGALKISKTVSGSGADQNAEFQFRVRVGELDGTYGGVAFTKGEATVSVKAGSSVDIAGLPAGASYSVTELSSAGYTVTSRNATGTIPDNATVTASFNNEKQGSGDSGGKDDGGDTPSLNREEHYAYIIGYKDGLLRPNGNISRAEVATIFFRLLRDPVRAEYWNQTNPYPDVPADMWCNNAISTLTNMGIISGYSDGTFRPNDPITRAELTKIAAGFFADKRVTAHYDGRFSDVSGSEWFVSALEKAIEEGIVQGYQDGTFAPDQYITRAQACTIINRTLGRKPEADRLLPESQMLTWPDSDPSAWYYAQMQEATNSHDYIWVTGSSGKVEKWTKKLPDRDWAALEHIWSRADSSTGGEAMN